MKSGSLILLEPSGPVQTCNGIALPLHFTSIRTSGLTVQPKCGGGGRSQTQYNYITDHADVYCDLLRYYAASSENFLADVSGQPIGHIFKGQASKSPLTRDLYVSRNVGRKINTTRCVM